LHKFKKFRASRGPQVLALFARCLDSPDADVVDAALSALLALRPATLPVTGTAILNALKFSACRSKILRLLSISKPSSVHERVIQDLVQSFGTGDRWSEIALLSLAKAEGAALVFTAYSDMWMGDRLSIKTRLQILLILTAFVDVRNAILSISGFTALLKQIIREGDPELVDGVIGLLDKLPIDAAFVRESSTADFVENCVRYVGSHSGDDAHRFGYNLVKVIGKVVPLEEFSGLIPIALADLRSESLAGEALQALLDMGRLDDLVDEMKRLKGVELLEQAMDSLSATDREIGRKVLYFLTG
jgi:hypothetical protein